MLRGLHLAKGAMLDALPTPPTLLPVYYNELAHSCNYFCFPISILPLPYPLTLALAPLLLSIPWPHSYWDSAYDDDVMENRVGLNLLYAQVSLELRQNPCPEMTMVLHFPKKTPSMSLVPVHGEVRRT